MAEMDMKTLGMNILLFLVLAVMAAFSFQLIQGLQAHQTLVEDRAELRHVKYGMLNADVWVRQVSRIVEKEIQALEIEGNNREALKRAIEQMLDTLITEADKQVRKQSRQGDWWTRVTGKVKESMRQSLVDINTVKAGIPEYADQILLELEKPETRQELSAFLSSMVHDISQSTFAKVDDSRRDEIRARYECRTSTACKKIISNQLKVVDEQARNFALIVAVCMLLLFLMSRFVSNTANTLPFVILSFGSVLLLFCGVLTPMMEVEAQISNLKFMLMGSPIEFHNEVFYFQSKSVLDVVTVLTATGKWDMMVVGILIATFSVVFPTFKLLASILYIYNPMKLRASAVVEFFALKSGKWSMADVMVIAIFMAYIGFNGMITSQLELISSGSFESGVDVLTTNGTSLQIGFFMFLGFCMASLLTSSMMESVIKPLKAEAD